MSEDRVDEYGYNIRNELISAAKNAKGAKVLEYRYQYDDIGNRVSSHDLGTNRTYTANNLNQYTSISNSASSALSAGEFIPQFDDDGNQTLIQTKTGIWQVQYNGENRPVVWQCVSTNSLTPNSSTPNSATPPLISMSYDRMGRRVTKNDQRFVYDGYLQIADNGGNVYIWDPTELVATRPLVFCQSNTQPLFYTHDGNKNVSEIFSGNSTVMAHYAYAPFGVDLIKYDTFVANPFRFSSEYIDDVGGVIYYNFRHYNYDCGRWIIRDPLTMKLKRRKPLTCKRSRQFYDIPIQDVCFVGNNPILNADYLGLACGSGWSEYVVPDSPGGFDFSSPCENHDNCYETCGRSKNDCDSSFLKDMMSVCSKQPEVVEELCFSSYTHSYTTCRDMPRARCENFARTYYNAVVRWGGNPYKNAQSKNGCCGDADNGND